MTSSESRSAQARRQERRRNRRLRITPLVYLKVLPNNGGLLVDLSVSGMCVSLAKPLTITEKVRFSFSLSEQRTIEGIGRVCWVSESGRKAGLEFAEAFHVPIEQIMAWLSDEDRSREALGSQLPEREPLAGFDSRTPAPDASPRQEIHTPAVTRHDGGPPVADTPLFFLPQKREEHEDVIPDLSNDSPRFASSEKEGEKSGCDSSVFRSALASGSAPAEEEDKRAKRSGLGKAVVRLALLLVLVALCFAAYKYEGPILSGETLVPRADRTIRTAMAKMGKRRRVIRRSSRPLENPGEVARVDRSGRVYSFFTPGRSGGSFSIQGSFPGLPSPSVRASGAGASSGEPENAGSGVSEKSFSGVKFIGLMATLRNDGALVEEGGTAVSPPKRSNSGSVLERIVLDVMVGKNGEVKNVRIVSSPDSKLAAAVMQSVRKWVYRPLYERGRAVEFTTRITLNFSKPSR